MDYVSLGFILPLGLLAWNEISTLKKKNLALENRLDELAKATGNDTLASDYISDDLKNQLLELKNKGDQVKAIKCLREETGFDLLRAKQYIDNLN